MSLSTTGDPAVQMWSPDRLEPADLLAAAERETGLSDWGSDPTFRTGLETLLASVENMSAAARLRPLVAPYVVRLLATRLRLTDDARRFPEVLAGPIERPLIVTGMPRTGTTWLYELLALDPAARAPLDWEVKRPWPAPEAATYETDPRIAEMEAVNQAIVNGAPELATMHNFHARLPQECDAFTTYHFVSSSFWAAYGVPDYLSWFTHGRPEGVFNTHRRVLQQLQWKGPRGRWTLKSPPHILMLHQLLAAYPDACLIQTHREPAKIVASLSNMVRSRRREHFSDEPELMEPKAIARSVVDHFGTGLERATNLRADPRVDGRFIDVAYRDIIRDPLPVLRRIYDFFDLPFTAVFEARVRAHVAAPRQTGHGQHKYDPEVFGVGELALAYRFEAYRARFGDLLADA
jgi:hypothetical protein